MTGGTAGAITPPGDITLAVRIDADLAAALKGAAHRQGWTPESLAADCIRQHLETALRHRVLIERMETIDAALMEMAEAVTELAIPSSGGIDLSKVCRYRREPTNSALRENLADPADRRDAAGDRFA